MGDGKKKGHSREQPFHCQAVARLRKAMICLTRMSPVADLSPLAGPSAEAKIQFMNAGDHGD